MMNARIQRNFWLIGTTFILGSVCWGAQSHHRETPAEARYRDQIENLKVPDRQTCGVKDLKEFIQESCAAQRFLEEGHRFYKEFKKDQAEIMAKVEEHKEFEQQQKQMQEQLADAERAAEQAAQDAAQAANDLADAGGGGSEGGGGGGGNEKGDGAGKQAAGGGAPPAGGAGGGDGAGKGGEVGAQSSINTPPGVNFAETRDVSAVDGLIAPLSSFATSLASLFDGLKPLAVSPFPFSSEKTSGKGGNDVSRPLGPFVNNNLGARKPIGQMAGGASGTGGTQGFGEGNGGGGFGSGTGGAGLMGGGDGAVMNLQGSPDSGPGQKGSSGIRVNKGESGDGGGGTAGSSGGEGSGDGKDDEGKVLAAKGSVDPRIQLFQAGAAASTQIVKHMGRLFQVFPAGWLKNEGCAKQPFKDVIAACTYEKPGKKPYNPIVDGLDKLVVRKDSNVNSGNLLIQARDLATTETQ